MANLIGNKIKSCVFISGKGSNLRSLIKSSREYNFPIKIDLIISNKLNKEFLAILYANSYHLLKFITLNSNFIMNFL